MKINISLNHFLIKKSDYEDLIKIMKICLLFLFAFTFQLMAFNTKAQDAVIHLKTSSITVEQLISEIEKQTDYLVVYSNRDIDIDQRVTFERKSDKVSEYLHEAFVNTNIGYDFENNYIVLSKKVRQTADIVTDILQPGQQVVKTVSGTVTDSKGEILIGVSVRIQNSNQGTVTDVDGNFVLTNVPVDATLLISYIGMVTQSIQVNNRSVINVVLQEDTALLDELVVIGFGTQRKINLTGAVGTATAKDFEARPVQNAVAALQGVIPGLNISTTGYAGELNASKSINIRGTGTVSSQTSGSPLILIDGMEGDINTINPQDIESISVLKDAAASSIYGSRAPFGVVLVTTKTGKQGRPVINYNNSFRFNTPNHLPKMMNSWEFVNYFEDGTFNATNNHWYPHISYMEKVKDYFDGKLDPKDVVWSMDGTGMNGAKWNYDWTNGNYDWMNGYYRDWSPSQEHNMSISGGNDKYTYYLSGNLLNQKGFIKHATDNYDRYNVTAKISAQITDIVKVDYSNRFVRAEFDKPTRWNNSFYTRIIRGARPTRPFYDPNGYIFSDVHNVDAMKNGGRYNEQNDDLSQQFKATVTPIKNWNIIGEFNVRTTNNWTHWDEQITYAHYANNPEATYVSLTSQVSQNQVYEQSYRSTFMSPNIYSSYNFSVGSNNFTLLAGFQAEQLKNRQLHAQRKDLINPSQPVLDLTTNAMPEISGNYQNWATAGYFGRINYDYNGKYLLEANLRYDASSRYRANQRWVLTPSISAGWNISQENFFGRLENHIQMLKLRASYGTLANQNTVNWYPTYTTIGTGSANSNWLINGAQVNTASVPGLVSTSLTWEKIYSMNFGLDFAALNSRLTGSFDYFVRETRDMVGAAERLPVILGTSVPPTNNTDLTTSGWEFEIGWRDKINDFSYGARLSIADSRTRIDRFANPTKNLNSYISGELTGNVYGYQTIGIAKTNEEMQEHLASLPNGGQSALGSRWNAGDIMYADLNNDGKIDSGNNSLDNKGDLKLLGNTNPRYITGLNLDIAWKGFDFQMFWQGVLKRDYFPGYGLPWPGDIMFWGIVNGGQWQSTALKEHLDYFRADENHALGQNIDSYYPRPLMNSDKNQKIQSRYTLNASYMRLKNMAIGYTIPKHIVNKIKLQNLRLYVSGENLLTITELTKVLDPESVGIGARGGTVYPLSTTYSFGLSVGF